MISLNDLILIDETVLWRYLVQCLKALQNLHDKGICHRDLKAANTFLAEDGSVKIGGMTEHVYRIKCILRMI
jgi:serine/threonine protein kinase